MKDVRSKPAAGRRLLRRGVRLLILAVILAVIVVALYWHAARWWVPRFVDDALAELAPGVSGRADVIRFDPFFWRLELDAVRFEQPGPLTFAAERIVAALSPQSALEGRFVWESVTVTAPDAALTFARQGPSLEPLFARFADWRVERLELTDGALEIGLSADPAESRLRLDDVGAEVIALDARGEPAGRATVSARGPGGAELEFDATLALGPARADGRFALRGLDIGALAPPDGRSAAPEPAGSLRISGDYAFYGAGPRAILELEGRLDGAGRVALIATPLELGLRLDELAAERMSPYARAVLGRGLAAGRIDLALDYQLTGEPSGRLGIGADGLLFAPALGARASDGGDADTNALELAVALLESPDGRLELAVPLTTVRFGDAVRSALRRRIRALTDAPFDVLGRLVGMSGMRLADVAFEPGTAALSESALETLAALAEALGARPKLGLRVPGTFHPSLDRDALAAQQIELHVLLATAGPTARARPAPIDFASPRAHDVLDEFAGERLPAARIQAIAARFAESLAEDAAPGLRAPYYRGLFDALAANETIEPQALRRLARFRAQAVADTLARRGIATERIAIDAVMALDVNAAGIDLPLELGPADRGP